MKRVFAVIGLVFFLCGCNTENSELNKAMLLRKHVVSASKCSLNVTVTAEYDEKVYTFDLKCTDNNKGLQFEACKPESISGITGIIEEDTGKLTFDDEVLAFELMIDNRLSPIAAPWLMLRMLKSGYISGCGGEGNGTHIQIEDSLGGVNVLMDLYTDERNNPIRADILWNGQRGLSVTVSEFTIV